MRSAVSVSWYYRAADNPNFSLVLSRSAVPSERIWAHVARYSESMTLAGSGITLPKVSGS